MPYYMGGILHTTSNRTIDLFIGRLNQYHLARYLQQVHGVRGRH